MMANAAASALRQASRLGLRQTLASSARAAPTLSRVAAIAPGRASRRGYVSETKQQDVGYSEVAWNDAEYALCSDVHFAVAANCDATGRFPSRDRSKGGRR